MIHTRFFDFNQGDRIVIKTNIKSFSSPLVTALVNDIQKSNKSTFLLFTDEYSFYPCPAFKWKNEDQRMLFWDLEPIKDSADIFIVDCLRKETDTANVVRLINETPTLKDKTIIFICDIPYSLSKSDVLDGHNIPIDNYTQEEIKFNNNCTNQGATAIYDLFTYCRSCGAIIYFINSKNKEEYKRLIHSKNRLDFNICEE